MSGVHAWLRALAGTAAPSQLLRRLNRFLCESTEAHRYVTLFYAELDPVHRRLVYVNGGHVPPFLLRAGGGRERLLEGGPALGLIDGAGYEHGQATMAEGDVLALVTDGVTEGVYPEDVEKGDALVFDALHAVRALDAEGILEALVASVQPPGGAAGSPDDLTALILKAQAQP
jgi:sigma-B regulation protein RsbU (phosphoserine phosphatase)